MSPILSQNQLPLAPGARVGVVFEVIRVGEADEQANVTLRAVEPCPGGGKFFPEVNVNAAHCVLIEPVGSGEQGAGSAGQGEKATEESGGGSQEAESGEGDEGDSGAGALASEVPAVPASGEEASGDTAPAA